MATEEKQRLTREIQQLKKALQGKNARIKQLQDENEELKDHRRKNTKLVDKLMGMVEPNDIDKENLKLKIHNDILKSVQEIGKLIDYADKLLTNSADRQLEQKCVISELESQLRFMLKDKYDKEVAQNDDFSNFNKYRATESSHLVVSDEDLRIETRNIKERFIVIQTGLRHEFDRNNKIEWGDNNDVHKPKKISRSEQKALPSKCQLCDEPFFDIKQARLHHKQEHAACGRFDQVYAKELSIHPPSIAIHHGGIKPNQGPDPLSLWYSDCDEDDNSTDFKETHNPLGVSVHSNKHRFLIIGEKRNTNTIRLNIQMPAKWSKDSRENDESFCITTVSFKSKVGLTLKQSRVVANAVDEYVFNEVRRFQRYAYSSEAEGTRWAVEHYVDYINVYLEDKTQVGDKVKTLIQKLLWDSFQIQSSNRQDKGDIQPLKSVQDYWLGVFKSDYSDQSEDDLFEDSQEDDEEDNRMNDDSGIQLKVREIWDIGDYVQVYSSSFNGWFKGQITKITTDNEGEWLSVIYEPNGQETRVKQLGRESLDIRPIND